MKNDNDFDDFIGFIAMANDEERPLAVLGSCFGNTITIVIVIVAIILLIGSCG